MGRPHRDFTTDDRFHLINHGVDGQDLFSIEDDWVLFESLMASACDDYGFRLTAYALMSNHYHLLADLSGCDDRPAVSQAFGVLQSTYARYFNERTNRRGPLFEPRFLSFGADGATKTHRVVRYIHRNPIDVCGPKALGNYRWSSLPVLLGRRVTPHWLDCSMFTPHDPIAHLLELTDCREEDFWPLDMLPPQRPTSLGAIEWAVNETSCGHLDHPTRSAIVAWVALALRAADIVDVAAHLGCTESNVRKAASNARQRIVDDPGFEGLLNRITSKLVRQ